MNWNPKGFSVVEVIFILAIAGLLGFGALYVWTSNNSETTKLETSGADPETSETSSEWITYNNEDLGISFAYPESWTFEDKSDTPTSTKSYYIGELVSDDEVINVAITLVREQDGRNIRTSIEEWETYASKLFTSYDNLVEIASQYTSFRYIHDVGGAYALVYEILSPDKNVHLSVLPSETNQVDVIDQLVGTMRLE